MKRISDAIARKRNVFAVLVPRGVARRLVDQWYPAQNTDPDSDAGRAKYLGWVTEGGYVGSIFEVPIVVADDVVICALTKRELIAAAPRLGIDVQKVLRELERRVTYVPALS